ncbi:MAG: hypothetical protein WA366_02050, partial [Pseudolabrys sp.]
AELEGAAAARQPHRQGVALTGNNNWDGFIGLLTIGGMAAVLMSALLPKADMCRCSLIVS